jgi:hypothetical protein
MSGMMIFSALAHLCTGAEFGANHLLYVVHGFPVGHNGTHGFTRLFGVSSGFPPGFLGYASGVDALPPSDPDDPPAYSLAGRGCGASFTFPDCWWCRGCFSTCGRW